MLQGVNYNIPVAIWLTEQYPQQAPLTYVVPTPDMIIKPRHSFVDASGEKSCLHQGLHHNLASAACPCVSGCHRWSAVLTAQPSWRYQLAKHDHQTFTLF